MSSCEGEDDWPLTLPVRRPVAELKQEAHDLFDPIWKEDRTLRREQAYRVLAKLLRVEEKKAHFKTMPRARLETAIRVIPGLRAMLRRSKLNLSSARRTRH